MREWLGALTAGRIVEIDPETTRYHLPPEHAAWLTRAASPDNLAVEAQWITTLSTVEDDIVACFRNGGGVPYERYSRFHEVMAEESAQTVLSVLFSHILPLVPGMTERLEEGASFLDLGCGRGRALLILAEALPEEHLSGLRPVGGRDRVRAASGRPSWDSTTSASSSATSARSTSTPSPKPLPTWRRSTRCTTRRGRWRS